MFSLLLSSHLSPVIVVGRKTDLPINKKALFSSVCDGEHLNHPSFRAKKSRAIQGAGAGTTFSPELLGIKYYLFFHAPFLPSW